MKRVIVFLSILSLIALPAESASKYEDRLKSCGTVLQEILNIPDDIPQNLLDDARCVIVIPSTIKGAFIFGATYGAGAMTCRSGDGMKGPWGPPTMMMIEGGSFGLQLGGQATDFVLLVMNEKGTNSLLSSKVKLGADASAAAGPVGRTAQASTDIAMRAEILTYSRSRGVFAGISLAGASLRPDQDGNTALYGRKVSPREIVHGGVVGVPAAAQTMIETLTKHSPKLSS
jgi:lipid-binding SYLF domain-containing protein